MQKTASEFLYFISLTEEWNFEDDANEFINKFVLSDDEKYPCVQFDKSGFFMTKELLFNEVKKINIINQEIVHFHDKEQAKKGQFPVQQTLSKNRALII